MGMTPTPPDNQEEELAKQTNADRELEEAVVKTHDKWLTLKLLDRLEAEGPKKMINYEPGYGEGYNAAIADQATLLAKIRKEIE